MRYIILLLLIIAACDDSSSPDENGSPVTEENFSAVSLSEEFLSLINEHRSSIGLSPLEHVEALGKIAETHSQNMASGKTSFGHTGFSDRCDEGRVVIGGGNLCAENVAKGQKTAKAAFDSWINSSGHKANIEQSRHTHTGFGYAKSSSGIFYFTQIFLESK